jgi:T5SS/PEP-CTERM-associated repeat protein
MCRRLLTWAAILFICVTPASAQIIGGFNDAIWLPDRTGSWFNTNNWHNDNAPTASKDAEIRSGTAQIGSPGARSRDTAIGVDANATVAVSGAGSWTVHGELQLGMRHSISVPVGSCDIDVETGEETCHPPPPPPPPMPPVTGALTIASGGEVTVNGDSLIGYGYGDDNGGLGSYGYGEIGIVSVDGAGSKWTNLGNAYIGGSELGAGRGGQLNITNGGTVTVQNALTVWDRASVNLSGEGSRLIVSDEANSQPVTTGVYVGSTTGAKTLEIVHGGKITGGNGQIDGKLRARVSVDGVHPETGASTWTGEKLVIGDVDSGDLTISNGGKAAFRELVIGQVKQSNGFLEVNNGSRLDFDSLTVGADGTGRLRVIGARALGVRAVVGASVSDMKGPSFVTIADSAEWTLSDSLDIGKSSYGQLDIDGFSRVKAQSVSIGTEKVAGHFGVVNVNGFDTTLESETLYVGKQGEGKLNISQNGRVANQNAFIGFGPDSSGSVSVLNGFWNIQNHLSIGQSGRGSLTILGNGHVGADEVEIGRRGRLHGRSKLTARNITNHGVIVPGQSPGTLTIEGNYIQGATGVLQIEFAGLGPEQFDIVEITGNVALGGTLEMSFLDGYAPSQGDVMNFLNIGGILSGDFTQIVFPNLRPGFEYETSFSGGVYTMTALNDGVLAVPEPGAIVLLLAAIPLITRRQRRP